MSFRFVYCAIGAAMASFVLGCGFDKDNPDYCPGLNPNNSCKQGDAGVDGPKTCSSSSECQAPTGVCDTAGSMMCVQCTVTERSACTGATPACLNNVCAPCTAHGQCSTSNVCLPEGSCADPGQVAYVAQTGSGTACTKAAPCGTLDAGVAANKPYVKVAAGLVKDDQTTIIARTVTVLADPGAKLDRDGDGVVLEVRGNGTNVSIYDLEITGGSGGVLGIGVSLPAGSMPTLSLVRAKIAENTGGGISSSGTLTVSQSTISNNTGGGISSSGTLTVSQSTISNNTGGGVSVTGGTFAIVGNVFFNNGTQLGNIGGVAITTVQNAANRLEFNSLNKNQAQDTVGCAINCTAGVFTARNNVMSGNATGTNMLQFGGSCLHTHSIARPGPVPPGTANSGADPLFVNTTTGDLHVMPGSPVLGAADPASALTGLAERDIDGQRRTTPADLGADEVP